MIKALSLFFVLIEFTFSLIWTSAGQLSDLGWTVQISENENSIATKKLRYRALSPLSSPSNAAQNIYSLQFGNFHAPCFPGMILLYLLCVMLKLMLTFLNPGLTFLRPGLRKVLLSHRHLGITQNNCQHS